MPPDASSRSRTYLPKIWGNTRHYHLTALLAGSLVIGCGTSAGRQEFREIRAHWLPGCGPRSDTRDTQIILQALGDFDPTPDTFESFGVTVNEAPLVVPEATRAVSLDVRSSFEKWLGLAGAPEAGDVDIGLWAVSNACVVEGGEEGRYPGDASGAAVGYSPSASLLLVAGGQGPASTTAMTVDLGTGRTAMVGDEDGPRTSRSGGTVTSFGRDLLVAGGVDPDTGTPLDWADVFRTTERSFDANRIALSRRRTRHAAVELASGETLLVGGEDDNGRALRALEVLSPETGEYRISGLAQLAAGRIDPVALRLSDDSVLVAGGTNDAGLPVELLEWLDRDAHDVTRSSAAFIQGATPTLGRAFAAMPGGGALVAGGCTLREPAASESAGCAATCRSGGCPSRDVFWILPDGTVNALADALDVDAPEPRFVAGAGGRPWLLAGTSERVFRVFDPFSGRFVAPLPQPVAPGELGARLLPLDAGAFAWVEGGDAGATVGGFRHGTRGPFTVAVTPLLLDGDEGLSFDRPAPGAIDDSGAALLTDPTAALVLTDTTYETLRISLSLTGGPPLFLLGDRTYGGDECAWPDGDPWPEVDGDIATTVTISRTTSGVRLERGDGARECTAPDGRVTVSILAKVALELRSVTVQRQPD